MESATFEDPDLSFMRLDPEPSERKLVAVIVTDPRISDFSAICHHLSMSPKIEIITVFQVFNHGFTDEISTLLHNKLLADLGSNNRQVIDARSEQGCTLALKVLAQAHLIITSNPYGFNDIRFNCWLHPAKIAYVPYSLWVNKRTDLTAESNITRASGVALLESEWHVRDYERTVPNATLKAVAAGFPRLFELKRLNKNRVTRSTSTITILWAPHWTSLRSPESRSYVAELASGLLRFCTIRSDIRVIYRPHPLFAEYLYRDTLGESVIEAIEALLASKVVSRGDDLSIPELILSIDIAVHNCGSFTAELAASGVPAVFSRAPNDFIFESLTSFGLRAMEGHYVSESAVQTMTLIDNLLSGVDPKHSLRVEIRRELEDTVRDDPAEASARKILDILFNT